MLGPPIPKAISTLKYLTFCTVYDPPFICVKWKVKCVIRKWKAHNKVRVMDNGIYHYDVFV